MYMYIPYDKTFSLVLWFLTSWLLPYRLTLFWKTLTLVITFKQEEIELLYCKCIDCDKIFHVEPQFLPCALDLKVWPTFEKL